MMYFLVIRCFNMYLTLLIVNPPPFFFFCCQCVDLVQAWANLPTLEPLGTGVPIDKEEDATCVSVWVTSAGIVKVLGGGGKSFLSILEGLLFLTSIV